MVRQFEIGRYHVDSENENGLIHLVDFSDRMFPKGRCSCHDFQIRVEPLLSRGENPKRKTCKHIEAVMRWLRMMTTKPKDE